MKCAALLEPKKETKVVIAIGVAPKTLLGGPDVDRFFKSISFQKK